jgi:hypothetical protein
MSEGTSWPSDNCRSFNQVVGRDISNELPDVVLANECLGEWPLRS